MSSKPQKNREEEIETDTSELPEGWASSTVAECFYEIRNGTTAQQNRERKGIPISRIETIQNGRFDLTRVGHIAEAEKDFVEAFRYKPGDIALSHINSYEHVGKTALYEGSPRLFLHGMNLLRLRLGHSEIVPAFEYFYAQTNTFREDVRQRVGHAVNQVSINQKNLSEVPLPIAPIEEQIRIADRLRAILPKSQPVLKHLENAKKFLQHFRQAVLAAACSGKLTEDWRKKAQVSDASTTLKQIELQRETTWNVQHGSSKGYVRPRCLDVNSLPSLPKGWQYASSDLLFSFVTSGSRGWAKYYSDFGPIFLRVGNLDHGTINLDLTDIQRVRPQHGLEQVRALVRENDILISITADVGMIGLVPPGIAEAYVNQHVAIARPVNQSYVQYLAWYLASWFGQEQFQDLQRGAIKVGLGLDDIRSVLVPFPPLEEQAEILRQLNLYFKFADAIEKRIAAASIRAEKLTQAILAKAFRGELVPTEAELARKEGRSYEPASVLLERIKAERASAEQKQPKREKKKTIAAAH